MELTDRLDPVLAIARETGHDVDTLGRFPTETVDALRASGLLGLTLPTEAGGLGAGPREFARTICQLASACGSSSMIYLMHVSAAMTVAANPPAGQPDLLSRLASGAALGSLAFSETGSRSHFWAPVSKSSRRGDDIRLDAPKSWVTSAGRADVYVISTLNSEADTIDLFAIPADTPGVEVTGDWRGMGLRGNASNPMTFACDVPADYRVAPAGGGFDVMMGTVLPWFTLGNASVSVGLSEGAVAAAIKHTSGARLEHLDTSLADLPTIRAQLAKMSIDLATTRTYVDATAGRIVEPAEDTMLHVLGVKAAANDAALRVTDAAMRVCGGAAFSAHLQVDRYFRDARAGSVMAPTADVLYDFYGKAITGRPLF